METANLKSPGFWLLFKGSFNLTFKHILSYIKLTILLILPFIVIGGILFAVFNFALAAPSTPSATTSTTQTATEKNAATATDTSGTSLNWSDWGATNDTKAINNYLNSTAGAGTVSALGGFSVATLIGMMGVFVVVYIIAFLVIILYEIAAILSFLKLTVLIDKGEDIHYWGMIKWAVKKIWSYILLMLRIFIYTFAWVPLAISILSIILGFAGLSVEGPIKYVYLILSLAGIVIMIIRTPRAAFAQYVLAEKDCTSKEALDDSIHAATGHWWKIVLYCLAFMIMVLFGIGIIAFALKYIHILASLVAGFVLMIFAMYLGLVFFYGLYRLLVALKKEVA